jgi:hypothetical protein
VVLDPGERHREAIVVVALPPPAAPARRPAPSPPDEGPPTGAFVLGGVGAAALVTAGILSIVGWVEASDMRDTCAPGAGGVGCSPDRVDRVRARWIAGGILAGVGGAAMIGGGVWLVSGKF